MTGKVKIERVLLLIKDMPTLPALVEEILRVIDSPKSSARELVEIIEQDQGVAARALRMANSAFYGFPRRISTIRDAVMLLGFNEVRNITLSASLFRFLEKPLAGYGLKAGELWLHSQACAAASRLIAREVNYRNPEQAYAAGLLHDIGKILLSYYLAEHYEKVIEKVTREKLSLTAIELSIFGFDHSLVGARAAEAWNLPREFVQVIRYHHRMVISPAMNNELIGIVNVANSLCRSMGIGTGIEGEVTQYEARALELLHLGEGDLKTIGASIRGQIGEAVASLEDD